MILSAFRRSEKTLAEQARNKGDRKKAIKLYQKHIQRSPGDLKVRREVALLLTAEGRVAEAIVQYEALAGAYAAAGLLLRAISACKAILEIDADHTETQAHLAELYSKKTSKDGDHSGKLSTAMSAALRAPVRESEVGEADIVDADAEGELYDAPDDDVSLDGEDVLDSTAAPPTLPPHAHSLPPLPADGVSAEGDAVDDELSLEDADIYEDADAADILSTQEIDLEESDIVILEVGDEGLTVGGVPDSALFSDLPRSALEALIRQLSVVRVRAGDPIVKQGDYGDSFYVMVTGRARVEREVDGVTQKVGLLRDGSFFGEIALLGRTERSASVIAEEYVELFEFTREAITALSVQHASVKRVIQRFCRERLLENMFRSSPVFRGLPADLEREAIRSFRKRSVRMGEVVIAEGDSAKGLFVIMSGQVEVSVQRDDAVSMLTELREGDVFGEMSLFFDVPAVATVTALKNTTLLRLSRRMFDRFCARHPSIKQNLLAITRERAKANKNSEIDFLSLPPI